MLKKEDALQTVYRKICRKKGFDSYYNSKKYVFQCVGCDVLMEVPISHLERHSGKCEACCQKKAPFFHLFKRLLNNAKNKNLEVTISFYDFLEFTKIENCYYCFSSLPWEPYCYKKGEYKSGGYFIDRKDNSYGYSKGNCVVCCTKCNYGKGDRYSHDEWYGMTEYFRKMPYEM